MEKLSSRPTVFIGAVEKIGLLDKLPIGSQKSANYNSSAITYLWNYYQQWNPGISHHQVTLYQEHYDQLGYSP